MRLLDVHQLELKEFPNDKTRPPYAILSHTWGDDEVSLQDFHTDAAVSMAGYAKIKKCCEMAIQDRFKYVWIDTCCIDKTSSAELSEAINSMYNWYQSADVCYAYLSDMQSGEDLSKKGSSFSRSRWFTRGWTLQELLASKIVMFYDGDWVEIGTKRSLQEDISRITGIPREALLNEEKLETFSIAQRMSWVAKRETTRVEDIAYCLMGIFDVNMPTLYGEGWKAFIRLQHEIMKSSSDHSLFAWIYRRSRAPGNRSLDLGIRNNEAGLEMIENLVVNHHNSGSLGGLKSGLLSSCPQYFEFAQDVQRTRGNNSILHPFSMTNNGLHIWLPMVRVPLPENEVYQIILNCDLRDGHGPLTIFLERDGSGQYSRIFPRLVCTAGNLEYDPEPIELYVKEDYLEERQKDKNKFNYELHLVENSSPNTGYTLMGASSRQILQHKMVNLLLAIGHSPMDIAFILVEAKHDHLARCLVALGVSTMEKSKIFYNIYAGKNDIEEAVTRICKDEHNQFSETLFKSVFLGLDPVNLGERIIQELPNGQRISITFRRGPGSGHAVQICNLIVEFITPALAKPPTLIC